MKKILISLMTVLALGWGTPTTAQTHRHAPQQVTVADTADTQDAIEVFPDTTSEAELDDGYVPDYDVDADDPSPRALVSQVLAGMDDDDVSNMFLVLGVLFILFVLAPVLILFVLLYFITKNRRERMRLAQAAMQNGQPIPDSLLDDKQAEPDEEYQKGMRQCFVGVGLMVFIAFAAGRVGFGVGALVFCIGLGKVFASRSARKNQDNTNHLDQNLL